MKTLIRAITLILLSASLGVPLSVGDTQSKQKPALETATFAGGCFWCMQPPFDRTKGVLSTVVGYTGGKEKNPTYEQVAAGRTGHREAVQITFDPSVVSYRELVDLYWKFIDPTQADGQFSDIGRHYVTAIFYHSTMQKTAAEQSREALAKSGIFKQPIVTEILPAAAFYPAEEYHQKYYLKKAAEYKRYAVGSGRVPFLERIWGKEK